MRHILESRLLINIWSITRSFSHHPWNKKHMWVLIQNFWGVTISNALNKHSLSTEYAISKSGLLHFCCFYSLPRTFSWGASRHPEFEYFHPVVGIAFGFNFMRITKSFGSTLLILKKKTLLESKRTQVLWVTICDTWSFLLKQAGIGIKVYLLNINFFFLESWQN